MQNEAQCKLHGTVICLAGQIITLNLGEILTELIRGFVFMKSDRRKTEKEKAICIERCVKYHTLTWTESQQGSRLFFLL